MGTRLSRAAAGFLAIAIAATPMVLSACLAFCAPALPHACHEAVPEAPPSVSIRAFDQSCCGESAAGIALEPARPVDDQDGPVLAHSTRARLHAPLHSRPRTSLLTHATPVGSVRRTPILRI